MVGGDEPPSRGAEAEAADSAAARGETDGSEDASAASSALPRAGGGDGEREAHGNSVHRSEAAEPAGAVRAPTPSATLSRSFTQRVMRKVSSLGLFRKKVSAARHAEAEQEAEERSDAPPLPTPVAQEERGSLLPPSRIAHSAHTLVARERDVRVELLQALVREHAHLRRSLSLGLAGLHGMSVLVAQEEARQIWLKEAVVVEQEAVATISVLRGLDGMIRKRSRYLDDTKQQGIKFLLQAQQIAKRPEARAGIADQVQALLPDGLSGRLELPDLHSMIVLLKAWEANKAGFVVSNDGASFQSPSDMLRMSEDLLEKVLNGRGKAKDELAHLLKSSSDIVNQRKKRQVPTLEKLGIEIQVLDATLQNLHEEQYHLEDHLDRALESQVCCNCYAHISVLCKTNGLV